jgi:hypothetical protein
LILFKELMTMRIEIPVPSLEVHRLGRELTDYHAIPEPFRPFYRTGVHALGAAFPDALGIAQRIASQPDTLSSDDTRLLYNRRRDRSYPEARDLLHVGHGLVQIGLGRRALVNSMEHSKEEGADYWRRLNSEIRGVSAQVMGDDEEGGQLVVARYVSKYRTRSSERQFHIGHTVNIGLTLEPHDDVLYPQEVSAHSTHTDLILPRRHGQPAVVLPHISRVRPNPGLIELSQVAGLLDELSH